MTPYRQAFDTYEAISNVFLVDNDMMEVVGKGSILVETQVMGQKRRITIHDVLHVPKLHANLLSVSKLASEGLKVHFNVMGCVVRAQSGEMLAMDSMEANLYQVELKKVNGVEVSTLADTSTNGDAMVLWHKRLGHLNAKGVKALQNIVSGMDLGKVPSNVVPFACEGYIEGK